MKFEFRGYMKAADDGLSVEEAMRKVKADWARMEALARELGKGPAAERVDPAAKPAQREDAVAPAPVTQPPPREPSRTPRVRML